MKKILFLFCALSVTLSACDLAVTIAPSIQPTLPGAIPTLIPVDTLIPPTAEPATPTPEVFIGLTQAITPTIPPNPTATQPPISNGTTVNYSPLTVTIPQAVASGASGQDFPRLDGDDTAWWEKTPGHLRVSLGDYYILQGKTHLPAIYVYPALAYVELVPPAFESIHRLQNYLYAPNNIPSLDQLPGVPFFNAQILFAAHVQTVSFQNGKGIRYISEYAQYPASANNTDLFYNFIGVTSGGEHYIVAIFPLTHPALPETSDGGAALPSGGVPYPYFADPNADMQTYYSAIAALLNTASPDAFFPSINQLDALIQSMWIIP
jgi:hypothetical protein